MRRRLATTTAIARSAPSHLRGSSGDPPRKGCRRGYGDSIFRGQDKIIGDGPDPGRARLIGIDSDGAGAQATLSSDLRVRRRLAGADVDAGVRQNFADRFDAGVFGKFHPQGKTVAVKYRRLNQAQRRHGNRGMLGKDRGDVLFNTLLHALKRFDGFFAVARQHVEAELRVEHIGFGSLRKFSTEAVCCCSSSSPFCPRSLAGSKI